ncbi:hypothetical protein [Streptomyces tricolor]
MDRAYEGYDARPVEDAVTVTAAALLAHPADPGNARIAKIADFTAPKEPLPHWRDHLALWAASRRSGSLPLDRCVIDLRAPELQSDRLVDRTGLARIAGLALDDLPHPKYGRRSLPVPQIETTEGPRWSEPVARDWAEEHGRAHKLQTLLSGTTTFGTEQPLGLVADHNRLTKIIGDSLEDADSRNQKRSLGRGKTKPEQSAAQLAWWPAVALSDNTNGFIPVAALRTTLVEAVVGGLAEDVERAAKTDKATVSLGDIRRDVVKLLDWYVLRELGGTPVPW